MAFPPPDPRQIRRTPQGERVFIRHLRASDEVEFVALRQGSRAYLAPWEPKPEPGFDAFTAADFERRLASANTDRSQRFVICLEKGNQIVGQASLGEIIWGSLRQAFLGYWAGERFAGRGYMTAGLSLVIEHGLRVMRLHRIEANVQPHNAPSLAVVRKLGMRREGFSPRYMQIQGRWADHERWAITIEDLEERQQASGATPRTH
jgi:ribosomal-protein-alanine N-acetyltransferase